MVKQKDEEEAHLEWTERGEQAWESCTCVSQVVSRERSSVAGIRYRVSDARWHGSLQIS